MPASNDIAQLFEEQRRELAENLQQTDPLQAAAETALSLVQQRTRRGLDRHEQPFRPYAPSTRKRKARKGQPTSPVTLTDTGSMLAGMTIQGGGHWGTQRRMVIKFGTQRDEQIARRHLTGTARMPQRDFLGLTVKEQQLITEQVTAAVKRAVPQDRRVHIITTEVFV